MDSLAPYPLRNRANVTEAVIERVARLLDDAAVSEARLPELKAAWPEVRFTWCSDDDVGHARPVLARAGYRLYLVDGTTHCLTLTTNYDSATGVVVAAVSEE